MNEKIQKDIVSEMESVLKRHNIKKASLFGSFARGEESSDSDVDILVEFPEGSDLFDLVDLKDELRKATGREVDVVTFGSISPYRRDYILKDQVAIL